MGYEPFSAELDALGADRDWPPFNGEPQADTSRLKEGLKASPYVYRDPRKIPPRAWLYDRRLIRGFISTTVAPGGIGKSSLELVEAIALATGRALLGVHVPVPCRVWYWCGEDPLEEIERRVAAILIRYGINPAELDGRLFLDSGRTSEIVIAETTRAGTVLALPVLAALRETIDENAIDVVILDPFISTHRVSENDNGAIDMVAKALNRIAERTRCAFSLVHHVRKGIGTPGNTTVEDGRGAGSLLAAARSARVLNQMTKDEAERAGVENHRAFFRVDNGKANLAPPPDRSSWFQLASVSLGNGPESFSFMDLSDQVAVVEPWEWPDTFEGISTDDLRTAQAEVAGCTAAGARFRLNVQSPDWVGIPIARALRLDPADKSHRSKVGRMLRVWVETGMFAVVEGKDGKGKPRDYVEVGKHVSDAGE
ncbi:AAA family ATPase [Methylobacterium sp. WL19]|nr:AAA family ATPase [Methylobacterium sp. WL19]